MCNNRHREIELGRAYYKYWGELRLIHQYLYFGRVLNCPESSLSLSANGNGFAIATHNRLRYYQITDWIHEVKHGIFTRHGGESQSPWSSLNVGGTVGDDLYAVRQNHQRMYESLDVNGESACTTWQVHGADVVVALGPVKGRRWLARADGMITNQTDVPLVMRYADCTPLMFYDPVQRAIGVAHAGWRGTVQGMAAAMAQAMSQTYNSKPADIQAAIGPSISKDCYQVGEEVVAAVDEYYGTENNLIRRDPTDGTAYFDLWAANKLDLERSGVEKVKIAEICTYQNTNEFFSHRAENGRTGRFGLVMSL